MIAAAGVLALLCLAASGLLDLVFKLYSGKRRSVGMLIFGVGCVWFLLHAGYLRAAQVSVAFDSATVGYGLLAAVAVTLSNILLLECMAHMPISSASTIYRLNTIPLVIMALLFLGEQLTHARAAGVGAGIAAWWHARRQLNGDTGTST